VLALTAVLTSASDDEDAVFGNEDAPGCTYQDDHHPHSCRHGNKWFGKLMRKVGKVTHKLRKAARKDPYLAQLNAFDWRKAGEHAKHKLTKYSKKLRRALAKAQRRVPKDSNQPKMMRTFADGVYQLFSVFGKGQSAYDVVDGSASLNQALGNLQKYHSNLEQKI
jgi:hypothetical protein